MAQITYRLNLSASKIPFVSQFQGATVIVPQSDQNYIPAVSPQTNQDPTDDKDRGIPQAYYCHNVMPTAHGLQSVGYSLRAAQAIASIQFDETWEIVDSSGNFVYMAINPTDRQTYVLGSNLLWTATTNKPGAGWTGKIFSAAVNGLTYVLFVGDDCYTYDFGTNTLVSAGIVGITVADKLGILSAVGYLIFWDGAKVYWSSTIDPTDFVPSLSTGAGSIAIQEARGAIIICAKISIGFVIYTQENSVLAVYSGNPNYPFNFREVSGSGGASDKSLVAYGTDPANHYIYTTSGLQLLTTTNCSTIFPDVTDFVAGKLFEDFDEATLSFIVDNLGPTIMRKKIFVVADRYLVISYGKLSLTHAIIFDIPNKRWGKLKISHTYCFDWVVLGAVNSEIPRESIAFLQADGTIYTVDFSVNAPTSMGILLLGKFQYIRNRLLGLDSVELQDIQPVSVCKIYDFYTLDSKTYVGKILGYEMPRDVTALVRQYNFSTVGKNHTIAIIGVFNLVSGVLTFHEDGRT